MGEASQLIFQYELGQLTLSFECILEMLLVVRRVEPILPVRFFPLFFANDEGKVKDGYFTT